MAQSKVDIDRDGNIHLVLANQVELTQSEQDELSRLQNAVGQLGHAETTLRKEAEMCELQLMNDPAYQRLLKLRGKAKLAREMKKKANIVLDAAYEQIYERRGLGQGKIDMYINSLPEAITSAPKHRGRPRKELTA